MIPTVFTTAFIYFGGHQRVIAAATIGGWSKLRREPYVRHELSIGRAVKKHVVLKRASLVIARLRTKEYMLVLGWMRRSVARRL